MRLTNMIGWVAARGVYITSLALTIWPKPKEAQQDTFHDILGSIYATPNLAAIEGVRAAANKVAAMYGEAGVEAFENMLDNIDPEDIFDFDTPMTEESLDELAEVDRMGRIMAQEIHKEQMRQVKIGKYVESALLKEFEEEVL